LPEPVADVFRTMGWRPKLKCCFYNCQRLVIDAHTLDRNTAGLTYVEGWVDIGIPIAHAWLVLNGDIVDPTLRGHAPNAYSEVGRYDVQQIETSVYETREWRILTPQLRNLDIGLLRTIGALNRLQTQGG
jgi:hypothetical protein